MTDDYTISFERSQLVHLIVLLKMNVARNEALLSLPPDKALSPDNKGLTEADLIDSLKLLKILEAVYHSKET